jgi:hypothetical protein
MDGYQQRALIINHTFCLSEIFGPHSHPLDLCSAGVPPAARQKNKIGERRRYFLIKVV